MARFKLGEIKQEPLQIITINVSTKQLKMIKILVDAGIAASRSELLRSMLAEYLPEKIQQLIHMDKIIDAREMEEDYVIVPNGDGTKTKYNIIKRLE